jgi:hypothetical protein
MTADHMYTVIGNEYGTSGTSANGTAMSSSYLFSPTAVTSGFENEDLYVVDEGNNRVVVRHEVARLSGLAERRVD